jgi:hypothetical protein
MAKRRANDSKVSEDNADDGSEDALRRIITKILGCSW